MKDKNQIQKKENQDGNSGRRSFISKIGKGLLVVSSISLVSLTQLGDILIFIPALKILRKHFVPITSL